MARKSDEHGPRHAACDHPDAPHRPADPPPQAAVLFLEPVFNRVDTVGPGELVVGLFAPDLLNPATGEPFADADEPGDTATFPAGVPADAINVDVLRFENNTAFDIDGLELRIVGSAVEPEQFNFTITRDPDVQAYFADVNGDGRIGLSDIFSTVEVSADRKTIAFSDGLIPVGGRFTDFIFSETSTGEPKLAAIDASFSTVPPPPPPADWLGA